MIKKINTYNQVKKLHKTVDWDNTYMFRVRGINPYTGNEVWVTKGWERNLADAELTLRISSNNWKKLRIIKKSIGEYMQEKQNIPKFN